MPVFFFMLLGVNLYVFSVYIRSSLQCCWLEVIESLYFTMKLVRLCICGRFDIDRYT